MLSAIQRSKERHKEMINIPTYIEKDAVSNHAADIARLGTKALIVTGRSSAKANGALRDITEVLDSTGTKYEIFDGISENPPVSEIMSARSLGISKGCDFVIGIGGGSPMDAAKAVSLLLFYSKEKEDFLYEKPDKTSGRAELDDYGQTICFPVICIPTTCGTGSEATGVSVLSRVDLRTKVSLPHRVYPSLALLDPTYLMYAPYKVLRNTAIDAMAHMIESYINTAATAESKALCIEGLKLWSKGKDVIIGKRRVGYVRDEHPENVTDYIRRKNDPEKAAAEDITDMKILEDMLKASNIAGKAIAITGTSLPHALSYRLTFEANVAHGPATGIFQPGFISHADEKTQKELFRAMDFRGLEDFKEFLGRSCDIGEITDLEYSIILENSIKDILKAPERIAKVPYPVDREVLESIVTA